MKINKETIVGITLVIIIFGIIAAVTGLYGVFYVGLAFIIAIVSINLFSRKSVAAKTGAVILNTDLIYKFLMPRKYKKAIKELEENELSRRAVTIIDQCGGVAPYAMAFYGLSIRYSAQRALGAFQLYRRLINEETEPSLLVSTVQEAIGHSAALSRYFWPSTGGRDSKEIKKLRKSRGEKLRKHYHLNDDSPLGNRDLRNAWEHFDEKLDLFLLSNDAGYFFPMPIINSHTLADDPVGKVFKLLDPDAECLVLLGQKYYFKPIQDEVEKIFSREK